LPDGLEKTTLTCVHSSCSCRDSKQARPEYESRYLQVHPTAR